MCLNELREKVVEERMEAAHLDEHMGLLPPAVQKEKINSEVYEEIAAIIARIERAANLLDNAPELQKLGEVNWGVSKWDDSFTYKEICGFDEKLPRYEPVENAPRGNGFFNALDRRSRKPSYPLGCRRFRIRNGAF